MICFYKQDDYKNKLRCLTNGKKYSKLNYQDKFEKLQSIKVIYWIQNPVYVTKFTPH